MSEQTLSIVVPDSIEPIIGWKALRIQEDGQLVSPQQGTVWPVKQRCEASCMKVSHSWQAVKTNRPNDAPPVVTGNAGSTMMVSSVSYVSGSAMAHGGGSMSMYPVERPSLVLPHGYKWSWEPSMHDPAKDDCTCGFYAVTDPRKCSPYLDASCVLAEVALWGNVVPAAEGARGQYAYPQKLYCLEHLADVAVLVADLYGVPLEVRDDKRPGEKRPIPKPDPGSPAHLMQHLPEPEPVSTTLELQSKRPAKQKLGTEMVGTPPLIALLGTSSILLLVTGMMLSMFVSGLFAPLMFAAAAGLVIAVARSGQ